MAFKNVTLAALAAALLAAAPAAQAQDADGKAYGELVYLADGSIMIISDIGIYPTAPELAAELAAAEATHVLFEPELDIVTRGTIATFDREQPFRMVYAHGAYR
ncbi:MAG: hypothetical protein AAGH70_04100 [Pseudomonadota bacterium]